MIFPEYYGAPVFAGVEFDMSSGISGHSFQMYVNTAQLYLYTVKLLEVEFYDGALSEVDFSGGALLEVEFYDGIGVLSNTMTFGDETFTTESRVINAVGGAV